MSKTPALWSSFFAQFSCNVKHETSVLDAPGNTLFTESLQENNAFKQQLHLQKKKKREVRLNIYLGKYIFLNFKTMFKYLKHTLGIFSFNHLLSC